jgi:hypothetical protein
VEAPLTSDQSKVVVGEVLVPLFLGDRSVGFKRDRQMVIPVGSKSLLFPAIAPMK